MTKKGILRQLRLCKNSGELALVKLATLSPQAGKAEVLCKIVREVADHTNEIKPPENISATVNNEMDALTLWTLICNLLLEHFSTNAGNINSTNVSFERNGLKELLWLNAKTIALLVAVKVLTQRKKDADKVSFNMNLSENASPVCFANSPEVRDDYK